MRGGRRRYSGWKGFQHAGVFAEIVLSWRNSTGQPEETPAGRDQGQATPARLGRTWSSGPGSLLGHFAPPLRGEKIVGVQIETAWSPMPKEESTEPVKVNK